MGASSGRVMAAAFDGSRIALREVHRFANGGVRREGTLYWDFDALVREVKAGLRKGIAEQEAAGQPVASVGIDTWGVDFGLIGEDGALLDTPVCYRDERTEGMMDAVFATEATRDEIFFETGIQFLPFNTIFQLAALRRTNPDLLARARHLLMIPDLFHYLLTGQVAVEFSNATTTQLYNPNQGGWSDALIAKLGLPRTVFPRIIQPGTRLGHFTPAVTAELGGAGVEVIAVATHDTGSAVAAVPATGTDFAYLSCGTWSLLGTEAVRPVISPQAAAFNFTNEGGVEGTIRLLKNIAGLWLLQESKAEWERQGRKYSWEEMTRMAAGAEPLRSFVDPDDGRFLAPGDMPGRVRDYCRETGQPVPETDGAVARCVTESLALRYGAVLGMLEQLAGRNLGALHMVGGGIQNRQLCQWAANATGREVVAGPVEATALGNVAVQLVAAGCVANIAGAREAIRNSESCTRYQPEDREVWIAAADRYARVTGKA